MYRFVRIGLFMALAMAIGLMSGWKSQDLLAKEGYDCIKTNEGCGPYKGCNPAVPGETSCFEVVRIPYPICGKKENKSCEENQRAKCARLQAHVGGLCPMQGGNCPGPVVESNDVYTQFACSPAVVVDDPITRTPK